jgi:radical SAM protein with 4Fe4S-binding SPASM domain
MNKDWPGRKECLGSEERNIASYAAKAIIFRIPLTVSFELTRRCSFRCVHCYLGDQSAIRRQEQEINTAAVLRLIDEMVASGTLFLTLTGGDPMLRPDFIEIYHHAVCSGLLVTVFCNGSLVTEEIVRTFAQYPPRAVEITLYGAQQATFESVTQQPGSFAACMAGIERLRRANIRLRLKTMVLSLNRDDLPALWNMAEEMGVPFRHDCSIIPAVPNSDNGGCANTGRDLQDTLRFRLPPEQAAAADLSIAKVKEKLLELDSRDDAPLESSSKLYCCGAGRSSCHITADGKMKPCIITMQPAVDVVDGGGRFAESWNKISTQFPAQEARASFPCSSCKDRKFCTGCPGNFALETGDAEQAASFYCQYAASRREQVYH